MVRHTMFYIMICITGCFSLIIPERLKGNDWILGLFRVHLEFWWAQSWQKIRCESISDAPEGSKWLQKLVQDRFLSHVGPKIFQDSGMSNKIYWVPIFMSHHHDWARGAHKDWHLAWLWSSSCSSWLPATWWVPRNTSTSGNLRSLVLSISY